METLTERITRYLLARLSRRAVLDLYESATNVGLLEGYPADEDQESGTVWTVADSTRHLMTGDNDKDRKMIARRPRKAKDHDPQQLRKTAERRKANNGKGAPQ